MRSVALLGLLGAAATVSAIPRPQGPANKAIKRRSVNLDQFKAEAGRAMYSSNAKTSETMRKAKVKFVKRADYVETAVEFAKTILPDAEFRVVGDHYVGDNGISHVYLMQTAHGLDIDNTNFNINIGRDGNVLSYGHSFFTGELPAESPLVKRAFSDPVVALKGAVELLELPVTTEATAEPMDKVETYKLVGTSGAQADPEARLVYYAKDDGTLALTWRVETDVVDNWLLSYMDAATGAEVHGLVDYVAHASFLVYPWGTNDPTDTGASRIVETNPALAAANPFGWFGTGTANYTTTRGNNGIAQVNTQGDSAYLNDYRPTSATLDFQYPWTTSSTPPSTYYDASVAQLFYTANTYHDLLYSLGFTEAAGNFQANNNGKGGAANDFVILNGQDGAGTNNADFSTPPDGSNPRMRMFLWTLSTPQRDGAFEAGVVIHEYTHGLSNRLTGGPATTSCLSGTESGGMGEGWGDFYATATRIKAADTAATDYTLGAWVDNNPNGIRAFPYSTSLTTNPYTYASANSLNEVHAIGTIWATMLNEVLWALVAVHGKSTAKFPTFSNGVPTDGKFLAEKLVLDGMALQPCMPNFVQARDAIIDADMNLTGGANKCTLWKAFAKRGLGTGAVYAASRRTESFALPSGC